MTAILTGGRTLTDALRSAGAPALVRLLELRPDLRHPVPRGLADLSSRATTSASVARALDELDAWQLQVTEALAALPDPTSDGQVVELVGGPADPIAATVDALRDRALLWGEGDQLHLVRAVREHFGRFPGGLAPPSPRPLDPDEVTARLGEVDDAARAVLDRLLWSPSGSVPSAERSVDVATARTPVDQLLARRLLRPVGPDAVLLPREVALTLRVGRFTPVPVPTDPPAVTHRERSLHLVDNAAAGAAYGLLHDLELAVHRVETVPHRLLRDGGVGLRDVAALAADLGTDVRHAAFVVEAAVAAGLLTPDGPQLAVTTDFDRWAGREAVDRWRTVATQWLDAPRLWARAAESGAHALGPEADLPRIAPARHLLLRLAVDLGPGSVPDLEDLARAARWHRPGLTHVGASSLDVVLPALWHEAAVLGLVALGATSSLAGLVLHGEQAVPGALADLFPTPVDRLILQADLTAVAPGPLPRTLGDDLRLLADQESRGGGGVFRFSDSSLRRAFDAGWTSAEVLDWLERHSTTGVPQPLAYLVEDVARRHGSIRVAAAGAVIRIDDDAQAAALLNRAEALALGLRRLAPGVLLAAADPYEVVQVLRAIGHSPAVEDDEGRTLTRPAPHRVRTRRRADDPAPMTAQHIAAAVLAGPEPAPGPALRAGQSTAETLRRLAAAIRDGHSLRLRYRSADGDAVELGATPLDLDGGRLRAVDDDTGRVLTIPLARVEFAGVTTARD